MVARAIRSSNSSGRRYTIATMLILLVENANLLGSSVPLVAVALVGRCRVVLGDDRVPHVS